MVVDVGVASALPEVPQLLPRKVRAATADLSLGPAMTVDEARQALDVGAEVAARLVRQGARCLVTGDMGIANTTPAAALIAALIDRPAAGVTGRGTGIDDDRLRRKTALVAAAADRARARHGADALAILAEVGGLEHAALAGFVAAAAALQVPVVIDGVISASALLVASRLVPGVEHGVIAGHRSVEPGALGRAGRTGPAPDDRPRPAAGRGHRGRPGAAIGGGRRSGAGRDGDFRPGGRHGEIGWARGIAARGGMTPAGAGASVGCETS